MSEHPNGLYFGLPEADYRADPALGSTDIKNLLVSPMEYWANSPMNPRHVDQSTDAKAFGTAYHKRILEGRAAFGECYAVLPDIDDYPEALVTMDDLKPVARELGLSLGGKKSELIDRILALRPETQIWDRIKERFEDENDGKAFIKRPVADELEYMAAFIERNPNLRDAFVGGFPEVSVFWEVAGVRLKARIDYLKTHLGVDLKTFSNSRRMPIDRAVHYAMADNRYHLQAALYGEALAQAQDYAERGRVSIGSGLAPSRQWLKEFAEPIDLDFYFVFQQKGPAPIAIGKKADPKLETMKCAVVGIQGAISVYQDCMATFGTDPWIEPIPVTSFDDTMFPIYMTE